MAPAREIKRKVARRPLVATGGPCRWKRTKFTTNGNDPSIRRSHGDQRNTDINQLHSGLKHRWIDKSDDSDKPKGTPVAKRNIADPA
jgi:hypothetical protein